MRLLLITLLLVSSLYSKSGILDIEWSKVTQKQQKPSIPYPNVLTKGVKDTRLPVYIPRLFAYDKNMVVVADRYFYTISFILKDATIMISGDRTFQEDFSNQGSKFQKMMKASNGVEFSIEEEARIITANFNKQGANYELQIECQTKSDKRCIKEDFIKNLYKQLIVVGGNK